MNYWLLKSEPSSYSIDDLCRAKNKTTSWDGVRNYQARNFMRDEMKKGDDAFFYHSNCKEPGIVGMVKIVREAYVDHTAFDSLDHHYDPKSEQAHPRWVMVDVKFHQKFKNIITLSALKQYDELKNLLILRKGNRLSVTPIDEKDWCFIVDRLG